jgi:RNA polymerase sigma-70 factor (ECF subfamily)
MEAIKHCLAGTAKRGAPIADEGLQPRDLRSDSVGKVSISGNIGSEVLGTVGVLDENLLGDGGGIAAGVADEDLLRAFVEAGDRHAFETLVRRYQSEIYHYLRRYMGDDDQAEDAFQLTFVKVYKKVEQFDLQRRFRPWLYGIATHQAIDLKRRNKRRLHASLDLGSSGDDARGTSQAASIPDHRGSQQDPLEHDELKVKIRAAVEEVGEPGRSALELIYLQGLPYRDAADILDVPVGTVKSRVHAAVRKLANIWKRNEEGND